MLDQQHLDRLKTLTLQNVKTNYPLFLQQISTQIAYWVRYHKHPDTDDGKLFVLSDYQTVGDLLKELIAPKSNLKPDGVPYSTVLNSLTRNYYYRCLFQALLPSFPGVKSLDGILEELAEQNPKTAKQDYKDLLQIAIDLESELDLFSQIASLNLAEVYKQGEQPAIEQYQQEQDRKKVSDDYLV